MVSIACYSAILLALALTRTANAQCLSNEFVIDEEVPNGTIVGNLFDRNVTRALQCLLGLLQKNDSVDLSKPASETLLLLLRLVGQPVLRDERFAFRDGNLIVAQRIDRESLCATKAVCTLDLQVSFVLPAGGNRVVFPVRVLVRDKDDNRPSWQSSQSEIAFYEQPDVKRKEFLGTVVDQDAVQDNFTLALFLLYDPSGLFELFVTQTGSFDDDKRSYDVFVQVKPSARLDRETRDHYVLHACVGQQRMRGMVTKRISVESLGKLMPPLMRHAPANDCLTVNVSVLDDNDNAPIVNSLVRLNVSEKFPENLTLYRFNATDLDEGVNGQLRYRFSASQNDRETFSLNDNGELSILKKLDFETSKHHVLKVDVFDSSSKPQTSTVEVFVTVIDENDEFPSIHVDASTSNAAINVSEQLETSVDRINDRMIAKNIIIRIPENSHGELVELTIADRDSGNNGQVTCNLLNRSPQFHLRPIASGVNFVVDLFVALDAENDSHSNLNFSVECTDAGQPSLRTVLNARIELIDQNDNAPQFVDLLVNASVEENQGPNTVVAQVHARDPDSSGDGVVTYRLLPSVAPFKIDARTGEISTTVSLDREIAQNFTLFVLATDAGNRSLSATATVLVHVTDANDQTPRFERNMYTFHVAEERPKNSVIGYVNASDRDIGENARLTYSLDCSGAHRGQQIRRALPFAIEPFTGLISLAGRLDRESQSVFNFQVCVADAGFPSNFGITDVTVLVQDVNDNAPLWLFPNATHFVLNVTHILPPGSTVAVLRAQDADAAENGTVIYAIVGGNTDKLFQLDPLDGTLIVARPVLPSDLAVHRLHVEAADTPAVGNGNVAVQLLVVFMNSIDLDHWNGRREDNISDLAVVVVLAIGTVTMLLIVFLVCICVCLIRQKRTREARRKRRRRSDVSATMSRTSSKHSVVKTHSKNHLSTSDPRATSEHCRALLNSLPSCKEIDYSIDKLSADGNSEIIAGEGIYRNSSVCKFYDDGKQYESRSNAASPGVEYDFMNRWVVALPAVKSMHDDLHQTIDDDNHSTHDIARRSTQRRVQLAVTKSAGFQRARRLATFTASRQCDSLQDSSTMDVLTPQSDRGPSLDNIHNQFLQRNSAIRTCANVDVDDVVNLSASVHTTPAKSQLRFVGQSQSRVCSKAKAKSKANVYSCLSHSGGAAVAAGSNRPTFIDIGHSCSSVTDKNAQAACASPLKHSVSPITVYMTRSPTAPCIDEYRPAQCATAPVIVSRLSSDTARLSNFSDNNNIHLLDGIAEAEANCASKTMPVVNNGKTQTSFV